MEITVKDGQNHNIIRCNRDMIIVIRTLKTRIVTYKKDSEESFKLNGARNGLISELFKELLTEIDSSESRGVIYRINLFKVA